MKLKVAEILNLESELYGLTITKDGESQVVFKGLLSQPLPLKVKYHLNRVAKKLTEEKEILSKTVQEGADEKELLQSEVEVDIDLSGISIDDIGSLETEFNYANFLNLIGNG